MKEFKARVFNDNNIELESATMLNELLKTFEADEDFLLQWEEKGLKKSEVIIANNIATKVKSGELRLTSTEKINEVKKC